MAIAVIAMAGYPSPQLKDSELMLNENIFISL